MADWKKVIVSGSGVSQLSNDSNYLVQGQDLAVLSGSFTGSFVGDGSGLTGVVAQNANALTDGNGIADFSYDGSSAASVSVQVDGGTLEVGAAGVKVADGGVDTAQLADASVESGKLADNAVTSGKIADNAFSVTISGDASGTANLASDDVAVSISLGAGVVDTAELADGAVTSAKLDALAVDTAAIDTAAVTTAKLADGAVTFGKLADAAVVTEAEGIASNDVDTAVPTAAAVKDYVDNNTAAGTLNISGSTGTGVVDLDTQVLSVEGDGSTINTSATGQAITVSVADSGIDTTQLAAGAVTNDKIAAGTIANSKLANPGMSLRGDTGQESVELGDTITIAGGTNITTVAAATDTVTVALDSEITVDDVTINNDLVVSGDLTVIGTASFQATQNLEVADRFILLASGSNTTGDGGIVVQQATQGTGEAFFWDTETSRWAVADAIDASVGAVTPDAFMAAVATGADVNAVDARYEAKGNIFVADNGDIFIYS